MKEKIGIVVAVEPEAMQFFEVFGPPTINFRGDYGYDVWAWSKFASEIYLIESGYGEIAAAAATQYLIDRCRVNKIINYGAVGGLHKGISAQTVGVVKKIVHYGFDLSANPKYPVGRYPNQDDLFLSPKADALPQAYLDEANDTWRDVDSVAKSEYEQVRGEMVEYLVSSPVAVGFRDVAIRLTTPAVRESYVAGVPVSTFVTNVM